jgi:hypothetical protein
MLNSESVSGAYEAGTRPADMRSFINETGMKRLLQPTDETAVGFTHI